MCVDPNLYKWARMPRHAWGRGSVCRSGCGAHPVRIIAAKGAQDSVLQSHSQGAPDLSFCVEAYSMLSGKEKLLKDGLSTAVSSNSTKVVLARSPRSSLEGTEDAGPKQNRMCNPSALGIQGKGSIPA